MGTRWMTVAVVALLALPASALAETTSDTPSTAKNASKLCKQLKAEMGVEAFKAAYGTNANRSNAHGKCVSKHRRAVKALIAEAISQCKAEQQAAQSASAPSGNGRGQDKQALRECVKQKLRTLLAERREDFQNAASQCRTERAADPDAFREKYGTNENKRNAFGKCVSKTARENQKPEAQS